MVQDVHAPNELRVNQQLKNLPEFYEATLKSRRGCYVLSTK
ncbi:MAG: M13-type metalloendopeptidase [Streptococcus salivarius]